MVDQKMADLIGTDDAGIKVYRAGDTVKGTVIDSSPSRILLDLEGGLTGIITRKEATGFYTEDEAVEPGTEIEAAVIDPESDQGLVVLSLRKASQDMVWAELNESLESGRIIKVKISEANKGGLMASYKGLRAFLPVSQLMPINYPRVEGADTARILKKLQKHIGKEFAVRVINVDRENGKVIISEKAAHEEQMKKTLHDLSVGDVIKGEVSGVLKYGIFVAHNGIEGLVHLSEMDWGHVSDPSKHYELGDKVEVVVIGIDGDKLSFSIKQLTEDPWKDKVKKYEEGQKVTGKVLRWNAQGVFIEIEPDVQGLFDLEQFGVEDYTELKLKEGEEMEGKIQSINYDSHRFELEKV
ncbi:S1 RNA-binding domain-containing protein [Candidatus Gracilibacteria bacterium]|nr:S1 RNA-binding domain-containing protein [Candidatus Gracilibacteria bacterium]MCF7819611.1 S1 RNA-binding domain-containing protein [Candidatus Gracilibacteria bacterium]